MDINARAGLSRGPARTNNRLAVAASQIRPTTLARIFGNQVRSMICVIPADQKGSAPGSAARSRPAPWSGCGSAWAWSAPWSSWSTAAKWFVSPSEHHIGGLENRGHESASFMCTTARKKRPEGWGMAIYGGSLSKIGSISGRWYPQQVCDELVVGAVHCRLRSVESGRRGHLTRYDRRALHLMLRRRGPLRPRFRRLCR